MAMQRISVGIAGGAGYTGGELLRLLLHHPYADIEFVHSRSNAGKPVSFVHGDLYGETGLHFVSEISTDIDVLFLCAGHGESRQLLEAYQLPERVRVIDLSNDFRLRESAQYEGRNFVYGLPEYNRDAIAAAANIANPGCFATAIQLALLPLTKLGSLKDVHVTGITGATGAGQKLQSSSHFAWRVNNIQAYKSLSHQHIPEVMQTLRALQPDCGPVHFIPWRGDFARGIYVTAYTECGMSLSDAWDHYESWYQTHPFTHVIRENMDLKQVVNTNKCLLHLEKVGQNLAIHSAIDNLLKGASGQAVQNMNLMFGFPEDAGLRLKPVAF
jgi:N-acetyl-gamma-glutamyl-phosphate reductase